MSAITLGNDLVHYEVLGRGKPIVFVHSWLGSWRYWIPTISQLGPKYRTYAIDLWGFGDSGKSESQYHLEGQVELVRAFVEKMAIPKAVFVGHGLGAAVLTHYAADPRYSAKVHRLMLISPPLFDFAPSKRPRTGHLLPASSTETVVRPEASGIDRQKLLEAAIAAGIEGLANKEKRTSDPSNALTGSKSAADNQAGKQGDLVDKNPLQHLMGDMNPLSLLNQHVDNSSPDYAKLETEVRKASIEVIRASTRSFEYISTLQELLRLSMPTLAVFGEADTLIPVPNADILNRVRKAPNTDYMILDGMRHFPMLEHTTNFVRLVREFLESADIFNLQIKELWQRRNR